MLDPSYAGPWWGWLSCLVGSGLCLVLAHEARAATVYGPGPEAFPMGGVPSTPRPPLWGRRHSWLGRERV
eukprot:scaffold41374_cov33-Tisochrysis_lutea.AAC.1